MLQKGGMRVADASLPHRCALEHADLITRRCAPCMAFHFSLLRPYASTASLSCSQSMRLNRLGQMGVLSVSMQPFADGGMRRYSFSSWLRSLSRDTSSRWDPSTLRVSSSGSGPSDSSAESASP
jgi:hypothetical protein